MPDKKLTDSEIKEVLDMVKAKTDQYCQECPYNDIKVCNICIFGKMKIVLDLINRLHAENERLKKGDERVVEACKELKAKNDGLKAELNCYKTWYFEAVEDIETAKTEAYKECIEKVKEKALSHYFDDVVLSVRIDDIDNLLKEMVGEDK